MHTRAVDLASSSSKWSTGESKHLCRIASAVTSSVLPLALDNVTRPKFFGCQGCSILFARLCSSDCSVDVSRALRNPSLQALAMAMTLPVDQNSTNCPLLDLPPELRLRIYAYLLPYRQSLTSLLVMIKRYQVRLASPYRYVPGPIAQRPRRMDLGILEVNKQIHGEATDALYVWNTFPLHFDYVCTCEDLYRAARFEFARIRRLEIYGFSADCTRLRCPMCSSGDSGLLNFFRGLPRLRTATVLFADIDSFAAVLAKLEQISCKDSDLPNPVLRSRCVGSIEMSGIPGHPELRLQPLVDAWKQAAQEEARNPWYPLSAARGIEDWRARNLAQGASWRDELLVALEWLKLAVITDGTCPAGLERFFEEDGGDGIRRLRLRSHADRAARTADFTIALAEVVSRMLDDERGSELRKSASDGLSMHWSFIEGTGASALAPRSAADPTHIPPAG